MYSYAHGIKEVYLLSGAVVAHNDLGFLFVSIKHNLYSYVTKCNDVSSLLINMLTMCLKNDTEERCGWKFLSLATSFILVSSMQQRKFID